MVKQRPHSSHTGCHTSGTCGDPQAEHHNYNEIPHRRSHFSVRLWLDRWAMTAPTFTQSQDVVSQAAVRKLPAASGKCWRSPRCVILGSYWRARDPARSRWVWWSRRRGAGSLQNGGAPHLAQSWARHTVFLVHPLLVVRVLTAVVIDYTGHETREGAQTEAQGTHALSVLEMAGEVFYFRFSGYLRRWES